MTYPDDWTCPICGAKNISRECTDCTFPKLWHCPECGSENHGGIICKKCGYNAVNPEESRFKVNKKFLIITGLTIYALIMLGIAGYIMTQDKVKFNGDLIKDERISVGFWTLITPNNLTFTFEGPNNSVKTVPGHRLNSTWRSSEITLNESGVWVLKVDKEYDNRVSTYEKSFKVNRECVKDEHCSSKGEDYVCEPEVGVCVQEEDGGKDFTDFLNIISGESG